MSTLAQRDYVSLNARLSLPAADGTVDFEADVEAAHAFFIDHVNVNMRFSTSRRERIDYLVKNGYYDAKTIDAYSWEFVDSLHEEIHGRKFRFATFFGAFKFYKSYALRERTATEEGGARKYLERYEDRVVMTALHLAQGDEDLARSIAEEIITLRFQPATPTFQNAGRTGGGELVSCFLLNVPDNIESIARTWMNAAFLSKIGGGVAICMTDVRAEGDILAGIEGLAKGVMPWAKVNETVFSGVDQLGQRPGAGAIYLNVHHPDILTILDAKRDNASEMSRLSTLSLGVVVPDITIEMSMREDEWLWTFSPYDIQREYGVPFSQISVTEMYDELMDNPKITKTKRGKVKDLFARIAEIQYESGYPYILFEDAANAANPIKGRVSMSNLCSEILQVSTPSQMNADGTYDVIGEDISCNLASLNIANVMNGPNFAKTIDTSIRALTAVSRMTDLVSVPTVRKANASGHSIGLGQMNMHGYLGSVGISYHDPNVAVGKGGASAEAIDFTSVYFAAVTFHALSASHRLAVELGGPFEGFEDSTYASGTYFDKYVTRDWLPTTAKVESLFADAKITLPTREDWAELREAIMRDGIYNRYLQAVPPTGSISYINNATSSIHAIPERIETREEGQVGRKYYPAYGLTNENKHLYVDAFEMGPYPTLDIYAAAQEHVDQALSLSLFFTDEQTTADINDAMLYAWVRGIKTMYYVRVRTAENDFGSGSDADCVACQL